MPDWREHILREFVPGIGRISVVADPDRLLTDPKLSEALDQRGFEVLMFEEPVEFRFSYETKYRVRFDAGQSVDLIVGHRGHVSSLPFDILTRGRPLAFSIADLFPNLSYPVLTALEPQYLEILYDVQQQFDCEILGENATKDFILRHVFEIAAELIKTEADLLRALLRRHYRLQVIPTVFVARLVEVLSGRFPGWPLTLLFEERGQFFTFLQERWPRFLRRIDDSSEAAVGSMVIPGPADIPFDHADVRVYIDNLFLEGLLQPIEWPDASKFSSGWFHVGIHRDPKRDRAQRFAGLLTVAERDVPPRDARHGEWLSYAQTWARLIVLSTEIGSSMDAAQSQRFGELRQNVDSTFRSWVERRFGTLHNLPPSPPTVVHHIARHLANGRTNDGAAKVALIVIDGLAFDQWLIVREEIASQKPHLRFDESAIFAWVPTVTSVSRQTIFAGKPPIYFPASIYQTDKEPSLWLQFWADHNLTAPEASYLRGLGEAASLRSVEEIVSSPRLRVLGLVVDKVDRIMHGMELGTAGMHNQVRQWASEGFMSALLDLLLSRGFTVFLTSDHGNLEATGCGRPKEGMLADVRGERVRIYSDQLLRTGTAAKFAETISWKPVGLPEDFLALIAPARRAFVLERQRTVAHGGITVEELIVPFVRVFGDDK